MGKGGQRKEKSKKIEGKDKMVGKELGKHGGKMNKTERWRKTTEEVVTSPQKTSILHSWSVRLFLRKLLD